MYSNSKVRLPGLPDKQAAGGGQRYGRNGRMVLAACVLEAYWIKRDRFESY